MVWKLQSNISEQVGIRAGKNFSERRCWLSRWVFGGRMACQTSLCLSELDRETVQLKSKGGD